MRPVSRGEILDYVTYGERREEIRKSVLREKERRRIHLGEHLTFLFENRETVSYQIQEMIRVERMVKEADIQHELETYNGILGGAGELGCTLLIEIDDPAERSRKLQAWHDLLGHLYLSLPDGTRVPCTFDPRQVGDDRLSAVQFLKFQTGGQIPEAVGCDFPGLTLEAALTADQREALAEDLAD